MDFFHDEDGTIWLMQYEGRLTGTRALAILAMEYGLHLDPEEYECSILTHTIGFEVLTDVIFRKRAGVRKDS